MLFGIGAPVLLSPVDGATGQPTSLTLDWEAVTGASYYEYQYSTGSSFVTYWNDYLEATEANITALNNDYTYYWRVRASDGSLFSEWSEVWSFTTVEAGGGLATPTLVSPANNETNVIVTPQLLWNVVPAANEYEYQYSTDDSFATYIGSTTQSTAISIGTLDNNTVYYWRVKATDGTQFSDWSETWSFTTENDVGVNSSSSSYVRIFPNPANDRIVTISQEPIQTISLVNPLGQTLVKEFVNAVYYEFNSTSLAPGIYFVKMKTPDKVRIEKVIIRH
jgi:hypothetical protein